MAGLTITPVFQTVIGDRRMHVVEVAFDSSYPTGGEALSNVDLGFAATEDPEFHVMVAQSGGYVLDYDHANAKVIAYWQTDPADTGGANVALVEVDDTTDLSGLTGVRVTAYGKYPA